MRTEITETSTAAPPVRFRLKAKVFEAGFFTFREFAHKLEVHPTYLSRVMNGWDWPSPTLQKKLADELGMSVKDLKDFL